MQSAATMNHRTLGRRSPRANAISARPYAPVTPTAAHSVKRIALTPAPPQVVHCGRGVLRTSKASGLKVYGRAAVRNGQRRVSRADSLVGFLDGFVGFGVAGRSVGGLGDWLWIVRFVHCALEISNRAAQCAADVAEFARSENDQDDHQQDQQM